jgi:hypothetical protein
MTTEHYAIGEIRNALGSGVVIVEQCQSRSEYSDPAFAPLRLRVLQTIAAATIRKTIKPSTMCHGCNGSGLAGENVTEAPSCIEEPVPSDSTTPEVYTL